MVVEGNNQSLFTPYHQDLVGFYFFKDKTAHGVAFFQGDLSFAPTWRAPWSLEIL
jgi:hypothetical protein